MEYRHTDTSWQEQPKMIEIRPCKKGCGIAAALSIQPVGFMRFAVKNSGLKAEASPPPYESACGTL